MPRILLRQNYSKHQLFHLERLRRAVQRSIDHQRLPHDDWRRRLIQHSLYSLWLTCCADGLEAEAGELLALVPRR